MATERYTGPTLIGDLAIDCTVTETHTARRRPLPSIL